MDSRSVRLFVHTFLKKKKLDLNLVRPSVIDLEVNTLLMDQLGNNSNGNGGSGGGSGGGGGGGDGQPVIPCLSGRAVVVSMEVAIQTVGRLKWGSIPRSQRPGPVHHRVWRNKSL
jgi:hypothetical protein